MVNMTFQLTPDSQSVRQKLTQLLSQRTELENELKVYMDILSANHVGMLDPLVDSEGYPRQDIDVYQVRNARNRVIYIQNDLRALMQEIENNIHLVHSIDGASSQATAANSNSNGVPVLNPVARIGDVVPNSPAQRAGLVKEDLIVEFGPINSSNFKSLQDIATTVRAGINRDISLTVLRNGARMRLSLKPQPFEGQGLVGCYFLNVENVER